MTDDLVKRLNMVDATMHQMTLVIVAREAASRIEQLEEALREICSIPAQKRGSASHAMLVIAAAALWEKTDG